MVFITKLIAIVSTVAFAGVRSSKPNDNAAPPVGIIAGPSPGAIQPTPQDFNVGLVWVDINAGGESGSLNVNGIPSSCLNIFGDFVDDISSIMVDSGISCSFFVDVNCKGAAVTVQNGAFAPDLEGTNFNDSLSSYKCVAA
ncbi:hypothetical protein QCA50_008673 [Cerrena zonata]|uniref:Uncharacterized protein n=1 Tax=Cerrena zonata TaxID=2478898 RepID=A0AAW0GED4_9APHY